MVEKKLKAVICAIAKNENAYINDWVNWHLRIGFDHIYLFDNNESPSDYVGNFIDEIDKVTIYDVNDIREENLQTKCYNKFYLENRDEFDWCLFCDIDEFLSGVNDIKHFLCDEKFSCFDQIRITWKTFSDGDMIERDMSIPVYKAFKHISDNEKLNRQAKPIIRGSLRGISISPHRGIRINSTDGKIGNLRSCLPSGKNCTTSEIMTEEVDGDISGEVVFINHYRTKSLSEFIIQKLGRGNACSLKKTIDVDYYWVSNKRTEEKEKFIEKYLRSGA